MKYKRPQETDDDPFEGLTDEEVAELLEVFFEDISEKIENLTRLILHLEESPGDRQTINSLFQVYHSLKGTVGTFGFYSVSEIFHRLEFLVEDVRENRLSVTPEFADLLLQSLDVFKKIVSRIKSRRPTKEQEQAVFALIEEFDRGRSRTAGQSISPDSQKRIIDRLKVEAEEFIKLKTSKIDTIIALSSELILRKRFDIEQIRRLSEVHGRLRMAELGGGPEDSGHRENLQATCRVLESLIGDIEYWKNSTAKLLDDLQYEVLQARMVDMNDYFQQLKRTVRDITRRENKKVRLVFSGIDTEIDRAVMEELKDPVMHIVRNAVDHGVEMPDDRVAAGKREEATIRISAHPAGDEITIIVEDDGRGIDLDAVRKIAVRKRLVNPDTVAAMSRHELTGLIFLPGFSTTSVVSEVSGRGVGLDVVKANIERIRGVLSLESETGKGTKFILKLPTTLTAFPALLLRAADFMFYLQLIAVERLIRIPAGYERPDAGVRFISLNGEVIPLRYLGEYINAAGSRPRNTGSYLLIIRAGEIRMAIEVDECIDQHEIVQKPSPDIVANAQILAGISVLPDGRLAYVLEPAGLKPAGTGCRESDSVWNIDELTFNIPLDFKRSADRTVFTTAEHANMTEMLFFTARKRRYALPVDAVDLVCDLRDDNLTAHLSELYDGVIVLKDGSAALVKKDELKNPLKFDSWKVKGSALLVKTDDENCILIPDSIDMIGFAEHGRYPSVKSTGKWKHMLPEIVEVTAEEEDK